MAFSLVLDRRHLRLERQGDTLVVRNPTGIERTVPMHGLGRVVLMTDTELTSSLLAHLAARGIALVAFGGRAGEHAAFVHGSGHNDVRPRLRQAVVASDWKLAAPYARRFVERKLRAQRRLLLRALEDRRGLHKPLFDALGSLDAILRNCRQTEAPSREQLLGFEGSASAAYFEALAHLFPPSLGFTGRRRRPPTDPVNAALSLGYTLLTHAADRAVSTVGLEPMIGFLHVPDHGRPSLACDFAEPHRPRIDRLVWTLFRSRALTADHFHREGAACVLGKTGRTRFYDVMLPLNERIERHLRREARLVIRALLASDEATAREQLVDEPSGIA